MSKKYFSIIFLFLLLFQACNEAQQKRPEDQNGSPASADFNISIRENGPSDPKGHKMQVYLQFSNLNASEIEIPRIKLNGKTVSFKVASDKLITIQNNEEMQAGKNLLSFYYKKNNVTDSIEKEFCYTINLGYELLRTYPHHHSHFTEGLLFDAAGNLYESTGLEKHSAIYVWQRSVNGFSIVDSVLNESDEFGEGIAIYNDELVQLLWKNKYLKIFKLKGLTHVRNLDYFSEGWGLCSAGSTLYASNGSSNISILDISGRSTAIARTLPVRDAQGAVSNINELEFNGSMLLANIWKTNFIYLIDPTNGYVTAKVDLTPIVEKESQLSQQIDVLNGIAYYPENNSLFITGKFYSNFYEIKLKPLPQQLTSR